MDLFDENDFSDDEQEFDEQSFEETVQQQYYTQDQPSAITQQDYLNINVISREEQKYEEEFDDEFEVMSDEKVIDKLQNRIDFINSKMVEKLKKRDINNLIKRTVADTKIEYKNLDGYILGYIGSNKGKELKEDVLKKVFNLLKKLAIPGMTESDVLRYSRHWILILK